MTKVMNNNRRDFLKVSGMTAALVASQGSLFAKTNVMSVENGKENYPNTNYTEDMYRNEFSFIYGKKEEHGFYFLTAGLLGILARFQFAAYYFN